MFNEYKENYFDIHKTKTSSVMKYIIKNLADCVYDLAETIKKNTNGNLESSIESFINTLKYPYKELTNASKNLYIVDLT